MNHVSKNRGFKLASLNITSIPGHIEDCEFIWIRNVLIYILAVNETRLDDTISSGRLWAVSLFCGPSSKTRDTQMATRKTDGARWERHEKGWRTRFARLAASPLARACTSLTKPEEKERLLQSKLVAKLQYQAISWREMIETETEGVSPFISGILSNKNVYLMSSAKASSGLAVR